MLWLNIACYAGSSLQAASGTTESIRWDTLPALNGLCSQDFLPPTTASDPQVFWVMRQEKMMALTQAL